ncbi:MAG: indole-3-glycerol phosphate synthase TrpC [Gemmatimonadota bacterium]|nr:indole-3-glycerol phosphate synthase TrpC [Gemmatimonadota bacterium]
MTVTLESILDAARARVRQLRAHRGSIEEAARAAPVAPDWSTGLRGSTLTVIAEVKRRSPSAGPIAPELDPATHARAFVAGGAGAISVLTDEAHFGGSLADLEAVASAVSVPLLRKDFILDPLQLHESRAAGASAVLLIVRVLAPAQLADLSAVAGDLGLARLVEVHTLDELELAVSLEPESIGVNSRDLETFRVQLDGAETVLRAVPPEVTAVAESGIATRTDVERVAAWGADAILVGTALARAPDPATRVAALSGVGRRGRGATRDARRTTSADR